MHWMQIGRKHYTMQAPYMLFAFASVLIVCEWMRNVESRRFIDECVFIEYA